MLGIFVDKKLTLKEGDALNLACKCLDWHSHRPKEAFILKTFSEARTAAKTAEATQIYMESKVAVFQDLESQDYLLKTLLTILESDGYVDCEKSFLGTVRATFAD
jgi:hypothetical protein